MTEDLSTIVLTKNIKKHNLKKGDLGTVVHKYSLDAFEVEFSTAEGKTIAVLTLKSSEVRELKRNEMLHVRPTVNV